MTDRELEKRVNKLEKKVKSLEIRTKRILILTIFITFLYLLMYKLIQINTANLENEIEALRHIFTTAPQNTTLP